MDKSLSFHHVVLSPDQQIGLHKQPSWELSYIIRGRGLRTIGRTVEPFVDGDLVLLPPDIDHCWEFDKSLTTTENITVKFTNGFIRAAMSAFPEYERTFGTMEQWDEAMRFTGATHARTVETLMRMTTASDSSKVALLTATLVDMAESVDTSFVGMREKVGNVQKRLKLIEIYIDCNYKRDISVNDIGRHVGMNHSAVCTFFKRHTGTTLHSSIVNRRFVAACHLLRNTGLTVQQICYESGFTDVPHFCRTFKERMGMTPKTYRQTAADET